MRNSPPTHQIGDASVMAPAGFTTHWHFNAGHAGTGSMPLRGVLRPSWPLPERNRHAGDFQMASERMLDGRVGAGRTGKVAHTPCQRFVRHSSRSTRRPLVQVQVGCVHRCHRLRRQQQNSSLAPRRRTRHPPINIHGCLLAKGRLGRKGRNGVWGGTPRHPNLHFKFKFKLHPQATTFLSLSPPGGIYLIRQFPQGATNTLPEARVGLVAEPTQASGGRFLTSERNCAL